MLASGADQPFALDLLATCEYGIGFVGRAQLFVEAPESSELMDYEIRSHVLVASAAVGILTIIGLVVGFDYASWIALFMMGMGAIIAIVQIVREAKSAKNLRQP